ncbi:MAG: hypothetical protein ABIS45_00300 [Burkholderiales bacterium]
MKNPYPTDQYRPQQNALLAALPAADRAKVAKATNVLQRAGLIQYDDGEITVLDRAGVEKRSCECYGVVKKESDRLLPLSA